MYLLDRRHPLPSGRGPQHRRRPRVQLGFWPQSAWLPRAPPMPRSRSTPGRWKAQHWGSPGAHRPGPPAQCRGRTHTADPGLQAALWAGGWGCRAVPVPLLPGPPPKPAGCWVRTDSACFQGKGEPRPASRAEWDGGKSCCQLAPAPPAASHVLRTALHSRTRWWPRVKTQPA